MSSVCGQNRLEGIPLSVIIIRKIVRVVSHVVPSGDEQPLYGDLGNIWESIVNLIFGFLYIGGVGVLAIVDHSGHGNVHIGPKNKKIGGVCEKGKGIQGLKSKFFYRVLKKPRPKPSA